MNLLNRIKNPRAAAPVTTEQIQNARLDAAAQDLRTAIADREQAMQDAADALAVATLRRDELQAKADAATARHRALAADRLALITATREAGDALVRDGKEDAGSAKLMTAATMEQGSDAAGAVVRHAELLAASLRGLLIEQESTCDALAADVEKARHKHEKARLALCLFEFDMAGAALVERATALLLAGETSVRLDLAVGNSAIYREVVGLATPQEYNRLPLHYVADARRAADKAAAASALALTE